MKKSAKFFLGILIGTALVYQFIVVQHFTQDKNVPTSAPVQQENNVPEINWDSVPQLTDKSKTEADNAVIEGEASNVKTPTAAMASTVDESVFDGCYAYATLSEGDRLLYNEIYTAIINHEESVLLTTKDLNRLEKAYYALDADHSEIYWVNGYNYIYYTTDGEITDIEFSPTYTFSKAEVDKYNEILETRKAAFLLNANQNMSEYEKAKYVYEVLIYNVEYDLDAENNQTVLSALLGGRTVCKGYACAAQYLLRELGIESVILNGFANNETHAWNCVKLDGEWYHYDVTWGNSKYQMPDDSVGKYVDYAYLNMTEDDVRRTHAIEVRFELPTCISMNNNYFVKEGRYIDQWDADYVGNIFANAWFTGAPSCNIKFANNELYADAMNYLFYEKNIVKHCKGIPSYAYLENPTANIITVNFNR